jgi:hypothetical protein
MHKGSTVYSVNLSPSFTKTLERLLTPSAPTATPTRPEDREKIDQRGHEVFCARLFNAHSAHKESK